MSFHDEALGDQTWKIAALSEIGNVPPAVETAHDRLRLYVRRRR